MTVDIRKAIQAKSDQLNADDLIGQDLTVRIENVTHGGKEHPVAVYYEGCEGKPWYPAKTALRAIVEAWGDVAADWHGKYLTLFRDPNVIYAGVKVGGIRIKAFSDIDADFTLMLAEKRGKKTEHRFKKLVIPNRQTAQKPERANQDPTLQIPKAITAINNVKDEASLDKMVQSEKFLAFRSSLGDRAVEIDDAVQAKRTELIAETVEEKPAGTDDF